MKLFYSQYTLVSAAYLGKRVAKQTMRTQAQPSVFSSVAVGCGVFR